MSDLGEETMRLMKSEAFDRGLTKEAIAAKLGTTFAKIEKAFANPTLDGLSDIALSMGLELDFKIKPKGKRP